MAASAASKYAQEEGSDSDRPLKVCAEAGRKCVKNIHQYPMLSVEWIALVDSLKQLTRLVQLEGRMPGNAKVVEAQGRNKDSDGTLWDQEAHETAIRILVEEAKVNLCLRMMNDYKKWCYNLEEKTATMRQALQVLDYSDVQLEQKMVQYEESLGMLLLRAFMHVETLQLMDIPLLIEHCVMVLEACRQIPPGKASLESQETVVLYYFASLMQHAEALNNSELLAKTKELRLVHMATDQTLRNYDVYPQELISAVAAGFAAMADNEDFRTAVDEVFEQPQDKARFLELEERVVAPILAANPEKKRDLRPLLDLFNALKRKR